MEPHWYKKQIKHSRKNILALLKKNFKLGNEEARHVSAELQNTIRKKLLDRDPVYYNYLWNRQHGLHNILKMVAEALRHGVPISSLLRLLKEENPNHMAMAYDTEKIINDNYDDYYYTLEELAKIIDDYINFLISNKTKMTKTGCPCIFTETSPWFTNKYWSYGFYPTKYWHLCNTKGKLEYQWLEKIGSDSERSENDVIINNPKDSIVGVFRPASYTKASFYENYTEETILRIHILREKAFHLYIELLSEISRGLKLEKSIWENCLKIITNALLSDEFSFLYDLSCPYFNNSDEPLLFFSRNNPLFNITSLMIHCEEEITIGTLRKTREALGDLMTLDEDQHPIILCDYFDVIDTPIRRQIDDAMKEFFSLVQEEEPFFNEDPRINNSFTSQLPETIRISFMEDSENSEAIKKHIMDYIDLATAYRKHTGEFPCVETIIKSQETPKRERVLVRFPSPPNLTWEEVKMEFMSKDSIKISARGISETYTFSEIGFKDNRKGDLPNELWDFLFYLSKRGGTTSLEAGEMEWKYFKMAKSAVSKIRKQFKTLMQIDDDPFKPYRSVDAYETKFKLTNSSYS